MTNTDEHITVCICTFKRPVHLARLLDRVSAQHTEGLFSISIVVIDNDNGSSGREAVFLSAQKTTIPIKYDVEPERNISLARNRSIANAEGNFIALIDDDEFPEEQWLIRHYRVLKDTSASGTLGPVRPHFDNKPPSWLIKSGLLSRREFATGEDLSDPRFTRTGNTLLRKSLFSEEGSRFDPAFGRIGGGDAAFFKKMIEKGHRFIWCNEAVVYETVLPERQVKSYYIKRAFTRGMTEALNTPFFSLQTLRSIMAVPLYLIILPFAGLLGQSVFIRYLVKECDHLSKILAYAGIRLIRERPY